MGLGSVYLSHYRRHPGRLSLAQCCDRVLELTEGALRPWD